CQTYFDEVTGIEGPAESLVFESALKQNYPNPFNPATTIAFSIAKSGHVSLKVFDTAGRLVRTLVDDENEPDHYRVTWDGRDNNNTVLASGVYFYQLKTDELIQMKRMVLMK
ncbi:MAG: T9SS type A sorting domain-containing protein, partial [Planctomycetes bacterium]|nr:T9SS type A sorting domain-containing protein [Planctomycetota bacterium]